VAHSFDPATHAWRTVGEWSYRFDPYHDMPSDGFFPFVAGGKVHAWLFIGTMRAQYGDISRYGQEYSRLTQLRPPSEQPSSSPPPDEIQVNHQYGATFVPATATAPALMVGGASSAAQAIGLDGRIVSLPSMHYARNNARVFRVAGGVLVVGGTDPGIRSDGRNRPKALPAEWLPPENSAPWQWQEVDGGAVDTDTALAQLKDESLLVVDPTGNVRQLRFVMREGQPALESQPHSRLLRERRHASETERMTVRELNDGRIIVAGGVVRSEFIALYSERALQPDQPDEYIGIGGFLPWRRYEIFDPATRRWRNSAPSQSTGGVVAIMGDGRVAKVGEMPKASGSENGSHTYVLEISDPSGTRWSTLARSAIEYYESTKTRWNTETRSGSHLIVIDGLRLFNIDDELFASGVTDFFECSGRCSRRALEWLNPATGQWELLWQAEPKDDWRKHQGSLLLLRRTLTGADGKSKTVIIPAGGF